MQYPSLSHIYCFIFIYVHHKIYFLFSFHTYLTPVGTPPMAKSGLCRRPDIYVEAVLGHVGVGVPDLLAGEAGEVLVTRWRKGGREEERKRARGEFLISW